MYHFTEKPLQLSNDQNADDIPEILARSFKKQSLDHGMVKLIKNFENTDLIVKISGEDKTIINCHLLVLQCYSDYFDAIDVNTHDIVLPADQVSVKAFVKIYEWMLSLKAHLPEDDLLEVLMAANYLEIKELQSQCWMHIDNEDKINEETAFLFYWKGRHLPMLDIREIMLNRVGRFFLSLVACQEFVQLNFDEVCILLKSNSVSVHTEAEVLFAAVRWLFYDWMNRQKYLLKVMTCVRFGLMTSWQLTEFHRNCDSLHLKTVLTNPDVAQMLKQGITVAVSKVENEPVASSSYLDTLNLSLPSERAWIRDQIWIDIFGGTEQTSYKVFNQYLTILQTKELNHWRTLTVHQQPYIGATARTAIGTSDSQYDIAEDLENVSIGD